MIKQLDEPAANLAVSVTMVESYRRYVQLSNNPDMPDETIRSVRDGLIETVKRSGGATEQMLIGTGAHAILESGIPPGLKVGDHGLYSHGYHYNPVDLAYLAGGLNKYSCGQNLLRAGQLFGIEREKWCTLNRDVYVKSRGEYERYNVLVRGRADVVTPDVIVDYKFTKSPDYRKYADSIQWRMYCLMLDIPEFAYCFAKVGMSNPRNLVRAVAICNDDINADSNFAGPWRVTDSEKYNFLRRFHADAYDPAVSESGYHWGTPFGCHPDEVIYYALIPLSDEGVVKRHTEPAKYCAEYEAVLTIPEYFQLWDVEGERPKASSLTVLSDGLGSVLTDSCRSLRVVEYSDCPVFNETKKELKIPVVQFSKVGVYALDAGDDLEQVCESAISEFVHFLVQEDLTKYVER